MVKSFHSWKENVRQFFYWRVLYGMGAFAMEKPVYRTDYPLLRKSELYDEAHYKPLMIRLRCL